VHKKLLMQLVIAGAAGFLAASQPVQAGTLYVNDGLAVYDYTTAGVRSTFSTNAGLTAIGMAFDSAGTLYAAARDSNAILKYTPAGVESTFASVTSPYGLAVDSSGNVYTGANSGSTINEYSPAGAVSTFSTNGDSVQSLVFDSQGNLFEGAGSGSIFEFAPNGTRTTFATGLNGTSFGMTFDGSGNLYVSEWSGDILKFAPNGTRSTFATFSTSTFLPTGLVYDYATTSLYMTEVFNGTSICCNQRIERFNAAGVESTFATGLYNPFGIADLQTNASAAPEPSTFLLIFGGLALIAMGGPCRGSEESTTGRRAGFVRWRRGLQK
jgi:sugar lactone lactonase YvrE